MLTTLLAACSSRPAAVPVASVAPTGVGGPVIALPLSTAAFMEMSASAALFSVRAANLAERRTRDREILSLARMQRANGRGIGSQLSYAGRRLDLLPAARLLPHHQLALDQLIRSRDFDRAYLEQQERIIPFMLEVHRTYAERGRSPTLRPVAQLASEMLEAEARAVAAVD